jgi:hypothetical protein
MLKRFKDLIENWVSPHKAVNMADKDFQELFHKSLPAIKHKKSGKIYIGKVGDTHFEVAAKTKSPLGKHWLRGFWHPGDSVKAAQKGKVKGKSIWHHDKLCHYDSLDLGKRRRPSAAARRKAGFIPAARIAREWRRGPRRRMRSMDRRLEKAQAWNQAREDDKS